MDILNEVIWIEANINGKNNIKYLEKLASIGGIEIKLFTGINEAIAYILTINFKDIVIIIRGSIYFQFIKKFKENLNNIYIIPKIIIFSDEKEFITKDKEELYFVNNSFYNYTGIKTSLDEIKKLVKNSKTNESLPNTKDKEQFIFEFIDSKEDFCNYASEDTSNDEIDKFTQFLFDKYIKLQKLLKPIISMHNIPLQLLSKYYARCYTYESDFYKDINKDLKENNSHIFLPFIKVLYKGVELNSFNLSTENILFRSSLIPNIEINKIKEFFNNKNGSAQNAIVFSKAFMSFIPDKNMAIQFLHSSNSIYSSVFFILEMDKNMDLNLSSFINLDRVNICEEEKKIIFLPFSTFAIKSIKETNINNKNCYEIKLLYLGNCYKKLNMISELYKENILVDSENKQEENSNEINLKNKIKQLNKEIIKLNEELKKEKDNNINLTKTIKELELLVSDMKNNNLIEKYKLNDALLKNDKKMKEELRLKEKDIINLKDFYNRDPFKLFKGEKLMSIIFISQNEDIHYSIICKNTDFFSGLEKLLYEKYPEYLENESINDFFVNGRIINKNKTLEENGIVNNSIITLKQIDKCN